MSLDGQSWSCTTTSCCSGSTCWQLSYLLYLAFVRAMTFKREVVPTQKETQLIIETENALDDMEDIS
jgi:hypothetical protein